MKVTLSFEVEGEAAEDLLVFADMLDINSPSYATLTEARCVAVLSYFFEEPLPILMAYLAASLGAEDKMLTPEMLREFCENAIRSYHRLMEGGAPKP